METKSDFAQKLLNDLRLRKERMATAQNSDAFGNSRQNIRGSRKAKTLETIGPKTGYTYKSTSTSQNTIATVQATNQIVPYGKGHHSEQTVDLSMAVACALDNGGKHKSLDFTSNGTLIGFLQQTDRRSMQHISKVQWQSTNQFPTLTNLHVDEIAKGTRKLHQILRACSNGINIDQGSIEIGKELWKGAMELEQSIRMLVSLQEASECMASPQRKSRLKLLEDGEDGEDESNISIDKQKQVERPVFSFDKASKNNFNKGSHTGQQQKLMALTYLKEDPNSEPKKKASMASKGSHRRSASCGPEIQAFQSAHSTKSKNDAGKLPNVIAKLMGLEELPEKANPSITEELPEKANPSIAKESQMVSKHKSGELVSTKTAFEGPNAAEVKIQYAKNVRVQANQEDIESNKIKKLKSRQHNMLEETYTLTYNYRTGNDLQNRRWNEEREAIRDHVKGSQEALSKINELKTQTTQPKQNGSSQKDIKTEARVNHTHKKQQEVKAEKETLVKMVPMKNINSEAASNTETDTLGNKNKYETEKRAGNKSLLHQHKQKRESQVQQVQVLLGSESRTKKIKSEYQSEERNPQRPNNKSEMRKIEGKSNTLKTSRNLADEAPKLQKQPLAKQADSAKQNNVEANETSTSRTEQSRENNKVHVTDSNAIKSGVQHESSASVKTRQNPSSTIQVSESQINQVCKPTKLDRKPTNKSATRVVDHIKQSRKGFPIHTNEVITRKVKTATKKARVVQPSTLQLHGLEQEDVKLSISRVSQATATKGKPTQTEPEIAKPDTQEPQHQVDAEHITEDTVSDESQHLEDAVALPPSDKALQNVMLKQDMRTSTDLDDQRVANEVQEFKPQGPATGNHLDQHENLHPLKNGPQEKQNAISVHNLARKENCKLDSHMDSRDKLYDSLPVQQRIIKPEKQQPLTDDEMYLKQKLITSHRFLNAAEALFKLNIPIGILNYASDQISQEKENKLILDCSYELLESKGRRQQIFFYARSNIFMSWTKFTSLDDLVRQLHKDFETLRSYGRTGRDEYDDADYILKMLERDMNYSDLDVNCMWDLGWNELMSAYVEMEEVIRDVERKVLEEIVDEIANDCM